MNKYIACSMLLAAVLIACGSGNPMSPQELRHDVDRLETAVAALQTTPTPTATPTATATPEPVPTATPEPAVYRLTWYGEEFRGGPLYCGSDMYGYYDPADPTTVAGVHEFPCGTRLELCADACIVVVVKDKCGGCGPGHLDVSRAAWQELGRPDYATVRVWP